MDELINIGQALGRSEMKKLMAGSGPSCSCTHNDCIIHFKQNEHSWSYSLNCSGEYSIYNGSGQYEGTLCGGQCP